MTVLVTGGAGYIGSHTVRLLAGLGRRVVVLDSLELGRRSRVLDVPLVVGDVADTDLVARTISEHDVDAVIHFAAYKAAGESMEIPGAYFRNIVGGRSQGYEQEAATAREQALGEMVQRATALGAQGVVGVSIEYAVLGQGNMLLVAATGTAVRFR